MLCVRSAYCVCEAEGLRTLVRRSRRPDPGVYSVTTCCTHQVTAATTMSRAAPSRRHARKACHPANPVQELAHNHSFRGDMMCDCDHQPPRSLPSGVSTSISETRYTRIVTTPSWQQWGRAADVVVRSRAASRASMTTSHRRDQAPRVSRAAEARGGIISEIDVSTTR